MIKKSVRLFNQVTSFKLYVKKLINNTSYVFNLIKIGFHLQRMFWNLTVLLKTNNIFLVFPKNIVNFTNVL